MSNVIEIKELTTTYKQKDKKNKEKTFPEIKNVSFSIKNKEILIILGESGSGKSTIINSIIGNIDGDIKGKIIVNGKDINDSNIFFMDISYISQTFPLYEEETLYSNIKVSYINSFSYILNKYNLSKKDFNDEDIKKISKKSKYAKPIDKRIAKELRREIKNDDYIDDIIKKNFKDFNMDSKDLDKKPQKISGGQRQRIAMIKAVIREPSLIIMDEPFSSLDKENTNNVISIIDKLKKEKGISFLISTHDFEDIDGYEDNAILLDKELKGISISGKIREIAQKDNDTARRYFNSDTIKIDENTFNNKKPLYIKPYDFIVSTKKTKNSIYLKLISDITKRNNNKQLTFIDEKSKKEFYVLIKNNKKEFIIGKKYYISLIEGVKND